MTDTTPDLRTALAAAVAESERRGYKTVTVARDDLAAILALANTEPVSPEPRKHPYPEPCDPATCTLPHHDYLPPVSELVPDVPQREPVSDVLGQGAVTGGTEPISPDGAS